MDETQLVSKIFTDAFNLGVKSCQDMLTAISSEADELNRHFEKLKLTLEDLDAED